MQIGTTSSHTSNSCRQFLSSTQASSFLSPKRVRENGHTVVGPKRQEFWVSWYAAYIAMCIGPTFRDETEHPGHASRRADKLHTQLTRRRCRRGARQAAPQRAPIIAQRWTLLPPRARISWLFTPGNSARTQFTASFPQLAHKAACRKIKHTVLRQYSRLSGHDSFSS